MMRQEDLSGKKYWKKDLLRRKLKLFMTSSAEKPGMMHFLNPLGYKMMLNIDKFRKSFKYQKGKDVNC